jgi:hypothetical protein
MELLNETAICDWYHYSLRKSGFRMVEPIVNNLWNRLALSGMCGVPPGFLAALMSKLVPFEIGQRIEDAPVFEAENIYINLIAGSKGADKLNKVFFIINMEDYQNNIIMSVEQIIRKLPIFEHKQMMFVESEFNRAFMRVTTDTPRIEMTDSAYFDGILNDMYNHLTNYCIENSLAFEEEDVFEVTYPTLFTQTSSKLFYRIMNRAMKAMEFWLRDTYTLEEESQWVITQYGEPQTLSIGGYDEITNKGTISSMLTSELAYMEDGLEFDLFDYKYIENQLLYFKRDMGSIYRIRRQILIKIDMTEFFEHEKNLGLLFAAVYSFATKIIEIYFKDMVNVLILLDGYRPTSMKVATTFFTHFLNVKGYSDRISFRLLRENDELYNFLYENCQIFIIANTPLEGHNFITFDFPQSDDFAALSQENQERYLGQLISKIIKRMVNNDYDETENQ